ncbi:MAG: TonB family protein [Bdellovibrionales bacterium]|nr:TonB family protein [Bdellovibrionales bacterium]
MNRRHHLFAFKFLGVSLVLLCGTILGIKTFLEKPKEAPISKVTNFNLSRTKRIRPTESTPKLQKKREQMKRKMKALKPALSAGLKGPSFGMDLGSLSDLGIDQDLLADNEDVIMDEDSVDAKPRILSRAAIEFPEKALADNVLKGSVEIRMLNNKEGHVTNTEILQSQPKGYFEEATLAMVQSWKFEPASYRGRSVAIWAKQVVRFGE